jgi:acyl-[acyl-carrier-protein]-phospholipid O-acyltransferase / long-chain-fatty-acid--[acyl-carrier-protein] ligase
VLVTTPTFMQLYIRRCTREQFDSLRLVVTGAEQLPDRIAESFEAKFGKPALQGYGTTECSPVVTINHPDRNRQGSVGHAIPEVELRIEDPETQETLSQGQEGMILVKGPNIMKGYLGREDLTQKVLRDGWYLTGDLGFLDPDGYLFITGRLSRFSKIGGEMVPHVVVEDALHEILEAEERLVAVTAVPDAKKGERLVVLHRLEAERIPALVESLSSRGLPNLFIPRPDSFVKVDDLPLLGSGKLDLKQVQFLAAQAFSR